MPAVGFVKYGGNLVDGTRQRYLPAKSRIAGSPVFRELGREEQSRTAILDPTPFADQVVSAASPVRQRTTFARPCARTDSEDHEFGRLQWCNDVVLGHRVLPAAD